MRKFRSFTAILLSAVLLFGTAVLFSCGKKEDGVISDTTKPETSAVPETTEAEKKSAVPANPNPLTGLEMDSSLTGKRPVAVMINNIDIALPQHGISGADIIYEAMAEGGITRLLAVTQDYSSLGVTGSIRSSREYFLDLAANHDAIYVHAGGAESAYAAMRARGVEHLDGVRGGSAAENEIFYRDTERINKMGYEHSMMTTGERLKKGISLSGFRLDKYGDFAEPFKFVYDESEVKWSSIPLGNICLTYNDYQQVFYKYDKSGEKYLRYQHHGVKHIDANTGEQLAFDNLLFIACPHAGTGDNYGHITINMVGQGDAFYVSHGKIAKLTWSRADVTSPFRFFFEDGSDARFLPGRFFVQIADNSVFWQTDFTSALNY